AVPDEFIAPPIEPLDNVRTSFEYGRIDIVGAGQPVLVEQVQVVPEANAVAIVTPGIVAVVLRSWRARPVGPEPAPKGKVFDVVAKGNREPGAFGPFVLRPLVDRHVVVTAMARELHESLPPFEHRFALFHKGGAAFGVVRAGKALIDQTLAQCEVARRL